MVLLSYYECLSGLTDEFITCSSFVNVKEIGGGKSSGVSRITFV